MNKDVTEALRRLQAGRARSSRPWDLDRHEEALDIILRNPDKSGNPIYMARNALRDADRKLQNRADLVDRNVAKINVMAQSSASRFDEEEPYTYDEMMIDVVDLIRRGVRSTDTEALSLALLHDVGDIELAAELSISRDATRQRLSRARRRARTEWETKH